MGNTAFKSQERGSICEQLQQEAIHRWKGADGIIYQSDILIIVKNEFVVTEMEGGVTRPPHTPPE